MDNLTHSLTGLMLSRAGINKHVPHASLLMILAANAPDCDVVSMLAGPEAYILYHRWITHSIFLTPLMALLPVIIVKLVYRKGSIPWLRSWLASLVGVASHWLLDYTNPYGVRLFAPFSDAWPALNITNVVDAWIWTFLLLATLAPALSRLISSEIGDKKTSGMGWAIFGLTAVLFYNTARYFLHERAIIVQEARIYGGEPPRHVHAYPTAINPMQWRGVIETESAWITQAVHLARDFDPAGARILHKPPPSPAFEAARTAGPVRAIMSFSPVLHWTSTPAPDIEGGRIIEAIDLRFGFSALAVIDANGAVVRSVFAF